MNNNNEQQQYEETAQVTYSSATATAVVSDDQQSRSLVGNMTDFYASNPYVYVPDTNLMSTQALPTNFFPSAAYFSTGAPAALDFLWTPWPFEMSHSWSASRRLPMDEFECFDESLNNPLEMANYWPESSPFLENFSMALPIHGSELNSPLVDYHQHQFPGSTNSSNQLHNRLPPLQTGLTVPTDFQLPSFMTRSAGNIGGGAAYGTRSQTSGRKGGRRPREIEDKDQFELTQEDKEKRAKRRERNKQAAARCRKRRMDLMESLQQQVDKLKEENNQKQMMIDQLNNQAQELVGLLRSHNCQVHSKLLQQPTRHLHPTSNKDQQMHYNEMMQQQQSVHLKMESEDGIDSHLQSEMELYKDDHLNGDRSSPITDAYPISTSSMIINNDPVISHATFQPSNKRTKHNQSPLILDSNESPAFSRPNTLPLITPQYCSSDLPSNLPSLNTPSAGLGIFTGNEFSLLNQQTFLTPLTIQQPFPVTSNANTPPHGELRQL